MRIWVAAASVAIVTTISGCGGGGSGDDAATLAIRDEAAQVRQARHAFRKAVDGQDLALGETVRTNGTGFVQIDYPDGSLTRIDSDATFTLRSLERTKQAQRVVAQLDGGRMWSRVERITSSEGRYEVDTQVATASVRGTAFDVDCRDPKGSCTFSVADGTVSVDPRHDRPVVLHRGESLTVSADGTVVDAPRGSRADLDQDPWIRGNAGLDAGRATRRPRSLGGEAFAGTYDVTRTVTANNGNTHYPMGPYDHFQLHLVCSGNPCELRATELPGLRLAGSRLVGVEHIPDTCPAGSGSGDVPTTQTEMLAVAARDAQGSVTKLQGSFSLAAEIPATCKAANQPVTVELVAVRTAGGSQPRSEPGGA